MRREKRMAYDMRAKVHAGACVGVERGRRRSKEAEATPRMLVVAMRELRAWILMWMRGTASWQTQQLKEEPTIHPRSTENLKREEEKNRGHRECRQQRCVKVMEDESQKQPKFTHLGNQPCKGSIQSPIRLSWSRWCALIEGRSF